jgi:RNA polymerase sigma-B factor
MPELTQELARAPRPSELARRLDVDVDEVIMALQAEESHDSAPLDAARSDDDSTLADRIPETDPRLEIVDDLVALGPLLERLPDRERRILELRFFGDRTQSQIAEEIGISQMHVSRLLSRTLAWLRRELAES